MNLSKKMCATAIATAITAGIVATPAATAATATPTPGGCRITASPAEYREYKIPLDGVFSDADIRNYLAAKGRDGAEKRAYAGELRTKISRESDPVAKRELERELVWAENAAVIADRKDNLFQACADRRTLTQDLTSLRPLPDKITPAPRAENFFNAMSSNIHAVVWSLVASLPSIGILGHIRSVLLNAIAV